MSLLLSNCRNVKVQPSLSDRSCAHLRRDRSVNAAFTGEATSGCTTAINYLGKVNIQVKNIVLSIYNVNYKFSFFCALIGFCIDGNLNFCAFMLKSMHNTSWNALPKLRTKPTLLYNVIVVNQLAAYRTLSRTVTYKFHWTTK